MTTSQTRILSHNAALILISGFLILLPLSTDLYLPTLPLLSGYFNTPVSTVQLTMSLYAATFAICQFIFGPISDRYGRLPIAHYGIGIYFGGTVICLFAPSIEWLIGGRVLQGIGACSSQVCLRAMTRDLYSPREGGHILAKAGIVMAFAPMLAPLISGFLVGQYGWRAAFVFLSLLSGFLLLLVLRLMRETNLNLNPEATRIAPMLQAYRTVLSHPTFIAYTLCGMLSYGALFAFLSGSPFVFMDVLGVSAATFGLCFSITMTGSLFGAYIARRLIPRIGLHGTLTLGGALAAGSMTVMLVLVWIGIHHILVIMMPMWLFALAHCINNPCMQAGAVAPFPEKAGSAAAMLGFLMMATASIVGWWIGVSYDGTMMPLAMTTCVISLLLLASCLILVRRYGKF